MVEYALVLVAVATSVTAASLSLAADFTTWITTLQRKINAVIT